MIFDKNGGCPKCSERFNLSVCGSGGNNFKDGFDEQSICDTCGTLFKNTYKIKLVKQEILEAKDD